MSRRSSRSSSRRSRRNGGGGTPWGAIAKVAGGGATLAGLGVVFFMVNQKAEATDPGTWCNRAGPAEVHLILLDASDPLDGVQAETARAKVISAIRAAPENARVDIYLADRGDGSLGEPIFSKCNPGQPGTFDAAISDVEKTKRDYEQGYLAAVEETMTKVLQVEPAKTSPIIESLRAAATKSFARLPESTPVKITLVSDMVQNSPMLRQSKGASEFDAFKKSAGWSSALVDLHHARISIVYVTRANYRDVQSNAHINWWSQYFDAMNGTLLESEAI